LPGIGIVCGALEMGECCSTMPYPARPPERLTSRGSRRVWAGLGALRFPYLLVGSGSDSESDPAPPLLPPLRRRQKKGGAEAPPEVEIDDRYCGRMVVGSLLLLSSTEP
jgi:hypothetical protein